MTTAAQVQLANLPQLFVHNVERIEMIIKELNNPIKPADKRLHEIEQMVNELQEFSVDVFEHRITTEKVFAASRLLLSALLDAGVCISDAVRNVLVSATSQPSANVRDEFKRLEECKECLRQEMQSRELQQPTTLGVISTGVTFLEFATSPAFKLKSEYIQSETERGKR